MKVALAVTVAWPIVAGGGFAGSAQTEFILLAACLLAVMVIEQGTQAFRAMTRSVPLTLLAVGALNVASSLWTAGAVTSSLRLGLVCAAYAVVAAATMSLATAGAAKALAAGLALAAFCEGGLGAVAVSLHMLPYAERLDTVWRPGGTFEYQPALALLEVGALPVFAWLLASARSRLRAAGAVGAVLAGAMVLLAADRLEELLALVVLLAPAVLRRRCSAYLVATAGVGLCAAVGAAVAAELLDRPVTLGARSPGLLPLVLLGTVAAVTAVVAVKLPGVSRGRLSRAPRRLAQLSAAGIVVLVAGAGVLLVRHLGTSGGHTAGILHGRLSEWRAALETWLRRPVLGFGGGAYFQASASRQQVAISRFAHNLPLQWAVELGLGGLLLALTLYAMSVRAAVRSWVDRDAMLLIPFVLVFLVSNLVDWTWYIPGLTVLWIMALGTCGALGDRRRHASVPYPASTSRYVVGA